MKSSVISSKQCCKINPTLYDKDGPDFNTNVKYNEPTFSLSDTDNNIDTVNSMHCPQHNFGPRSDGNDNCSDDVYDPQGHQSTTISKVQIQLNNLINNHNASLKLNDDIFNLFNDYVSSPNFDKYTRFKTRKSFIQSTERNYSVTHLRPKYSNVILHDGGEVTVPVCDSKSMIMDLLTNQKCMNTLNIAKEYDVFTGDVDKSGI